MRVTKYRRRNRLKLIFQGMIVLGLVVVALVGALQIKVVREFFSEASGEPANIKVSATKVVGVMPRPWRNLAQGGEDHAWRIQPITNQVRALHPTYIRIDHIYDFYDIVGGSPGNLTFDFSKLDGLLDDIAAVGATPYISLSYMPPAISSGSIIDPPQNYADWELVVQRTIEHISGARGTANVYYEVWNEPDLFGGWKYYGDRNYITLYNASARGAARATGVKPYKFGGAATTALYKNWFDALAKNAVNNRVRFDFFSWHRYDHSIDRYRDDMTEVRTWLKAYPTLEPSLELHITEWGHDSENHSGYDNNYGAAHTVAGAIEMVGVVERAFVFEIQDGKDPKGEKLWGRWGLLTHNDFGATAKPRYNALKLLDKIGNQRLQLLGKGSWVKALAAKNNQGDIQIVLSNFDVYGKHTEAVPITLTDMPSGSYTVTREFHNGQLQSTAASVSDGTLVTNVHLSPNTVVLVTIAKK
ncbi:MAG: hypothetical protein H6773_02545 [Pseudomonadales bacterium]|nr:hypothetical protein [Pseudomonadales bacterium]